MAFQLTIEKVDNGYLCYSPDIESAKVVFEEEEDELSAPESLLWFIMEYFDFAGSKHDAERLFVIRRKQK